MADGLDNSDDAGAAEVDIIVLPGGNNAALTKAPNEPEERIVLRDNGPGMTPDQALKCASLAYTRPGEGRIGMVRVRVRRRALGGADAARRAAPQYGRGFQNCIFGAGDAGLLVSRTAPGLLTFVLLSMRYLEEAHAPCLLSLLARAPQR